jgi:hypothetical protein
MRSNLGLSIAAGLLLATLAPAWAEEGTNPVELAQAVPQATVSLASGLKASESKGNPISAKFEIDNGALQLSVYTMNRDQFTEVIVDHWSGTIAKAEPITSGDDLKAAGVQGAAMAKAQMKLEAAVDKAVAANAGYLAVEVEPKLEGDRPLAAITLMKGQDIKKVNVNLD